MTLEELWQLFPIQLVEHRDEWAGYYDEMKSALEKIFEDYPKIRISHIGSTAINGIWAKPIIDIMVETDDGCDLGTLAQMAEQGGFIRMSEEANRISLNLGYTENGFAKKVYHLHLRRFGDNSELYFRDYLNEFPEIAKAYEQLKLGLWKRFEHNRDGYTAAKTEFIEKYTKTARERYGGRY